MKNSITILMMIFMVGPIAFSQVGINTTSPDASAVLDVYSTEKGFLPPRLNDTQIEALNLLGANGGPATGLVVYNTSVDCLQVNKGTPINPDWICLQSGGTDTGGGGGGGTTIVNGVCTLPQVPQDSGDPSTDGTEIIDLPTPSGQIWMDKNLGAGRRAQSLSDAQAFGDYYQFGRGKDGHEDVNSTLLYATSISPSVIPGHGDFIAGNLSPTSALYLAASHNNWVDIGLACDAALYQNGNDPCPDGYRVPTIQEWENEFPSTMTAAQKENHWENVMFLPAAGFRRGTNSPGGITTAQTWMMASDVNPNTNITASIQAQVTDSHFVMGRTKFASSTSSTIGTNTSVAYAEGVQIRCIKE